MKGKYSVCPLAGCRLVKQVRKYLVNRLTGQRVNRIVTMKVKISVPEGVSIFKEIQEYSRKVFRDDPYLTPKSS